LTASPRSFLEARKIAFFSWSPSPATRSQMDEREDALGLGVHRGELALGGDDRLDGLLGVLEGGDEVGLGQLVGGAFDHHHVVLVADVDEIEVGVVLLLVGGIDDEATFDTTDADAGDRAVPRDVGAEERGGGAVHHEDVGVVDLVGREQQADHLDFIEEAFGEERAQRAVAEAGGQDLLVGGLAFAAEVAAREAAGGGELLAVVDGQGEEVLVGGAEILGGGGRHEERGLSLADGDGAVGETGDGAGADGDTEFFDGHRVFLFHVVLGVVPGGMPGGFWVWVGKADVPALGRDVWGTETPGGGGHLRRLSFAIRAL